MTTIQETIAAKQRAMIPQRLTRGAEVLGRLWREGARCRSEWAGICPCAEPNDFCLSKLKWLGLVKEFHGGKYPHELSGLEGFLVLECMTQKDFEASGLTIVRTMPGARSPIRVGRGGTCPQTILDLREIYENDPANYAAAVECVVKIQEIGL